MAVSGILSPSLRSPTALVPPRTSHPIIIIGSGLAGYSLAREFRKLDKDTPLHIITADDGRAYSKPMLSNALTSGKMPEQLATADAAQMSTQLNASIDTYTRVSAIDTARHTITVDGKEINYARLVLALGADVIRLPMEGDAADAVMSINDLADYTRFRQALSQNTAQPKQPSTAFGRPARRVAIIGAGLIGCEFANDLCNAGMAVDVIAPSKAPLDRLLPETAGQALQQGLTQLGVNWHLGRTVTAVNHADSGAGNAYLLTLSDGSILETDVVLSCVGLRSRLALAQAAGLQVRHGIVVNRLLATSAPDVYALGDCAEVEGLVLLFVMPLMNAARALARTLAGQATPVAYPAMPVVVKTPAHAVVVSPPPPGISGEWRIETPAGGVRALFFDAEKKLRGFAVTGSVAGEKTVLAKELPALLQ